MKYAIFNNQFVTASRSRTGAICPLCKAAVIPKCGEIRVHHWAHKKRHLCDSWREVDSHWRHRWLERFDDCEIESIIESENEKHFVDVMTRNGAMILLRRKQLSKEDMLNMEKFFRSLVWIVDVNKQKTLFNGFQKALDEAKLCHLFRNAYSASFDCWGCWKWSRVPVVFDFSGQGHPSLKDFLWCLIPCESQVFNEKRVLLRYTKKRLIELLKRREPLSSKQLQKRLRQLNSLVTVYEQ